MSSYYALQVLRTEDVVWASSSRAKLPNLYVKVSLGNEVRKTPVIERNIAPSWTTTLTLPMGGNSGDQDLRVQLKHKSSLPWNQSVGVAVVNLETLLAESAIDEVKVELHPSGSQQSSTVTGVLFLRMRSVDNRQAVEGMIDGAQDDTENIAPPAVAALSDTVTEVQGRVDENWNLLQSVIELAKQVEPFVTVMNRVASVHPYLNVTWQVVSSLQKVIKGQADDDEAVVGLVRAMKDTFQMTRDLDGLPDKLKSLDDTMVEFFKQSSEYCTFIREYAVHGFIRRAVRDRNHGKIEEFKQRFNEIKAALTDGTVIQTAFVSARTKRMVDLIYLRQELNPPEMDASNRPQCLAGTRADSLNDIMDWVYSGMDTNMLWLHGVAGSGKSTISATIAKYCFDMNRQGAHLFFLRGKSNPNAVIRTIAFWLASFDQFIAKHVTAAVKNNNGIGTAPLESQFKKLLLQPLHAAENAMNGPVVVVLDALDECGTPDDRTKLVKLLRDEFPKLPSWFRFIVTSRPEMDIMKSFGLRKGIHTIELDYTSKTSQDDVFKYLDVEFRAVFDGQLMTDWNETMGVLGKAADGLFIWAATASKMVRRSDDPLKELRDLVNYCRPRDSQSQPMSSFGLDDLYHTMLENSGIQWHVPLSRERFRQLLGLILFSKAPVTRRTIDSMLGFSSHTMLSRLASVLVYTPGSADAPVLLFHTSFSDYLLAPERRDQYWFIDEAAQRSLLPAVCFDVMANKLSFNICKLESSFLPNDGVHDLHDRIKKYIPSHLEYACQYWAQHLCDVPHTQASSNLREKLTTFVQQHLLYWFESLSLTKHFSCVASRSLYDASLWAGLHWSDISSELWSAYRFASIFWYPMSRSAPHVYLSALSLGMRDFTITKHYSKILPIIPSQRFGTKPQQSCLMHIQGHTDSVLSVAFSPDGRRIASGSDDKSIRVWDVDSGEAVSSLFKEHTGVVGSVAFSSDRRRMASALNQGSIRVSDGRYTDGLSTISAEGPEARVSSLNKSEHLSHPEGRESLSIKDDICTMPSWNISDDGWLHGKGGELVVWISENVRDTLWYPSTTAILNCEFSTKLDLMNARLGEGWYKGYPRKLSS